MHGYISIPAFNNENSNLKKKTNYNGNFSFIDKFRSAEGEEEEEDKGGTSR